MDEKSDISLQSEPGKSGPSKKMVLYEDMPFAGKTSKETLRALFDSGASFSCIRSDLAGVLGGAYEMLQPLSLQTASEDKVVEVRQKVVLDFWFDGYRLSDEFLVIEGLSEEAIIGALTMQKWKLKLDFEHDRVLIDPRAVKLKLM